MQDRQGGECGADSWVAGDGVGDPPADEYEEFDCETNPAGDLDRCFTGTTRVVEHVESAPQCGCDQW